MKIRQTSPITWVLFTSLMWKFHSDVLCTLASNFPRKTFPSTVWAWASVNKATIIDEIANFFIFHSCWERIIGKLFVAKFLVRHVFEASLSFQSNACSVPLWDINAKICGVKLFCSCDLSLALTDIQHIINQRQKLRQEQQQWHFQLLQKAQWGLPRDWGKQKQVKDNHGKSLAEAVMSGNINHVVFLSGSRLDFYFARD